MLTAITNFLVHVISIAGYPGIIVLMAIESCAIPLPSEVIMPFSGFLVSTGTFSLLGISLAGAFGSVIGSLVLYYIGKYGGRPFIEKYGKYVLMDVGDLDKADRFFKKYGDFSNFIGRILPIVRTFISLPAGVSRVNVKKFVLYSFIGSFVWSLFLGYIGLKLGENWGVIHSYFHNLDILLGALIVLGIIWFIYKHIRRFREQRSRD